MPLPLALELYHLIIRCAHDNADLRSLALCCSAFRDEAQCVLFFHVNLKSPRQQKLFLSTINSAPDHLGPLVNGFYSENRWWNNTDSAVPLATALKAMYNLKHIKLDWEAPSTILQRCRFTLHTFVNTYRVHSAEALYLLREFLPTQVDLKHLEIRTTPEINQIEDVNVPTNLCPHLDSLGTNSNSLITTLLPNTRLISHFQWYRFRRVMPALSVRQINHLKSIRFQSVSDLHVSFSQHLISLVILDLFMEVYHHVDELLRIIEVLQHLPRLQVFVVEIEHPYEEMLDEEVYSKLSFFFRRVFELCQSLKRMDVNYDHKGIMFKRLVGQLNGDNGTWVLKLLGSVHAGNLRDVRFGVQDIN